MDNEKLISDILMLIKMYEKLPQNKQIVVYLESLRTELDRLRNESN